LLYQNKGKAFKAGPTHNCLGETTAREKKVKSYQQVQTCTNDKTAEIKRFVILSHDNAFPSAG